MLASIACRAIRRSCWPTGARFRSGISGPGIPIYGTVSRGRYRRYTITEVIDHWMVRKPAYRVTLENGTELVTSGDHRFLSDRGWKHVTGAEQGRLRRPHLTLNNKLDGHRQRSNLRRSEALTTSAATSAAWFAATATCRHPAVRASRPAACRQSTGSVSPSRTSRRWRVRRSTSTTSASRRRASASPQRTATTARSTRSAPARRGPSRRSASTSPGRARRPTSGTRASSPASTTPRATSAAAAASGSATPIRSSSTGRRSPAAACACRSSSSVPASRSGTSASAAASSSSCGSSTSPTRRSPASGRSRGAPSSPRAS